LIKEKAKAIFGRMLFSEQKKNNITLWIPFIRTWNQSGLHRDSLEANCEFAPDDSLIEYYIG